MIQKKRLLVALEPEDLARLIQIANRERRTAQAQAGLLLAEALADERLDPMRAAIYRRLASKEQGP